MARGTLASKLRAALLVAACAAPGAVRADGLSLQLEPSVAVSETDVTGVDGSTSHSDLTLYVQRYRLSLGVTPWPLVRLTAGGTFDWTLTSSVLDDEEKRDIDSRNWNGYARLDVGSNVLHSSANYLRRTSSSSVTVGPRRLDSPTLIGENYGATVGWRPGGGPALSLLASRNHNRDEDRTTTDQVTDQIAATASYQEIEHLDLRGSVRFSHPEDRIGGTESHELSETASVLWDDAFLDRRVHATAGYNVSRRDTETTATRPDAAVLQQQLPFEGLSLVEAAVDVPERVTLIPNRALIDGDLETSAGLDVGFGVRLGGDARARDAGVQFADPHTPVNVVHVHVDRALPPEVWGTLRWRAFTSDDNVTWTEVAVDAAGIRFGDFENRIELPIARVEARYVKVVTTPLLPGVTTDPAFASILLTELRLYLRQQAAEVVGRRSETGGSLSATVRALLERSYALTYDGGFFVQHGNDNGWNLMNGLSAGHRLGETSAWSARVDRTDSGGDVPHSAVTRASASLSSDPLPTLGGALATSAQLTENEAGTGWAVSSSAVARADLYEGVSLSANAGVGYGENERTQRTRFASVATTASVTPHPTATFSGSYFHSAALTEGPGATGLWDRRWRAEGSALLSPFPALSVSASIAHSREAGRPATLASFAVNASPFQGGDLVMRFGYVETIDTGIDSRSRQWGPGLRLNIRPGSNLDLAYTVQTTRSRPVDTDSSGFFANLVITLR